MFRFVCILIVSQWVAACATYQAIETSPRQGGMVSISTGILEEQAYSHAEKLMTETCNQGFDVSKEGFPRHYYQNQKKLQQFDDQDWIITYRCKSATSTAAMSME